MIDTHGEDSLKYTTSFGQSRKNAGNLLPPRSPHLSSQNQRHVLIPDHQSSAQQNHYYTSNNQISEYSQIKSLQNQQKMQHRVSRESHQQAPPYYEVNHDKLRSRRQVENRKPLYSRNSHIDSYQENSSAATINHNEYLDAEEFRMSREAEMYQKQSNGLSSSRRWRRTAEQNYTKVGNSHQAYNQTGGGSRSARSTNLEQQIILTQKRSARNNLASERSTLQNWEIRTTKEGFIYFYLPGTNTYQWNFPVVFNPVSGKKRTLFAEDWHREYDKAGKKYYRNQRTGQTQEAAIMGNICFLELYLGARGSLTITDNRGRNALHHSVANGHRQFSIMLCEFGNFENLIEQVDKQGNTPFFLAVKHNREVTLKVLFEFNCNVFHRNKKQNTCLHIAASYNSHEILLTLGAVLTQDFFHAKNKDGLMASELAVQLRHYDLARSLQVMEQNLLMNQALSHRDGPQSEQNFDDTYDEFQPGSNQNAPGSSAIRRGNHNLDRSGDHLDFQGHQSRLIQNTETKRSLFENGFKFSQNYIEERRRNPHSIADRESARNQQSSRYFTHRSNASQRQLSKRAQSVANLTSSRIERSYFDDEMQAKISRSARSRQRNMSQDNMGVQGSFFERAFKSTRGFVSYMSQIMSNTYQRVIGGEINSYQQGSYRNQVLPFQEDPPTTSTLQSNPNEQEVRLMTSTRGIQDRHQNNDGDDSDFGYESSFANYEEMKFAAESRQIPKNARNIDNNNFGERMYQQSISDDEDRGRHQSSSLSQSGEGNENNGLGGYVTAYDRSQSRRTATNRQSSLRNSTSYQQKQAAHLQSNGALLLQGQINLKRANQQQVVTFAQQRDSNNHEESGVEMKSMCIQADPPPRKSNKKHRKLNQLDLSRRSVGCGSMRIDETTLNETSQTKKGANSGVTGTNNSTTEKSKNSKGKQFGEEAKKFVKKRFLSSEDENGRQSVDGAPRIVPKLASIEDRRQFLTFLSAQSGEDQQQQQLTTMQGVQDGFIKSKPLPPSGLRQSQRQPLPKPQLVNQQESSNQKQIQEVKLATNLDELEYETTAKKKNQSAEYALEKEEITNNTNSARQTNDTSKAPQSHFKDKLKSFQEKMASHDLTELAIQEQGILSERSQNQRKDSEELIFNKFAPLEQDEENYEFQNHNEKHFEATQVDFDILNDLKEELLDQISACSFEQDQFGKRNRQNQDSKNTVLDRAQLLQSAVQLQSGIQNDPQNVSRQSQDQARTPFSGIQKTQLPIISSSKLLYKGRPLLSYQSDSETLFSQKQRPNLATNNFKRKIQLPPSKVQKNSKEIEQGKPKVVENLQLKSENYGQDLKKNDQEKEEQLQQIQEERNKMILNLFQEEAETIRLKQRSNFENLMSNQENNADYSEPPSEVFRGNETTIVRHNETIVEDNDNKTNNNTQFHLTKSEENLSKIENFAGQSLLLNQGGQQSILNKSSKSSKISQKQNVSKSDRYSHINRGEADYTAGTPRIYNNNATNESSLINFDLTKDVDDLKEEIAVQLDFEPQESDSTFPPREMFNKLQERGPSKNEQTPMKRHHDFMDDLEQISQIDSLEGSNVKLQDDSKTNLSQTKTSPVKNLFEKEDENSKNVQALKIGQNHQLSGNEQNQFFYTKQTPRKNLISLPKSIKDISSADEEAAPLQISQTPKIAQKESVNELFTKHKTSHSVTTKLHKKVEIPQNNQFFKPLHQTGGTASEDEEVMWRARNLNAPRGIRGVPLAMHSSVNNGRKSSNLPLYKGRQHTKSVNQITFSPKSSQQQQESMQGNPEQDVLKDGSAKKEESKKESVTDRFKSTLQKFKANKLISGGSSNANNSKISQGIAAISFSNLSNIALTPRKKTPKN